jgi:N-acylneuraminate cytidylyltransferase
MINGKKVLALIPARSGSKRLPNKNILQLGGRPLVEIAVSSAKGSVYIDRIVVSSDSDEIIALSGAEGIKRPPELATDTATSAEVALHALQELPGYDYLVLLQPTSPFRTPQDINQCIMHAQKAGSSVSETLGKPNGAVYVISVPLFERSGQFLQGLPYAMARSIDIDTQEDFEEAQELLRQIQFSSVQ